MIKVRGTSDDLIELEGDIREEFYADEDGNYLAFSNGVALRIHYTTEGVWRITKVREGSAGATIQYAEDFEGFDDGDSYSDVAEVIGNVKWVICGTQLVKANA